MPSNDEVKQQMFSHVDEWQRSGLTQKTYCIEKGIAYHVFHYWYKCYRDENNIASSRPSSFVQLKVQPAVSVPAVELLLADGKRLLFYQAVSSDYLRSLIS